MREHNQDISCYPLFLLSLKSTLTSLLLSRPFHSGWCQVSTKGLRGNLKHLFTMHISKRKIPKKRSKTCFPKKKKRKYLTYTPLRTLMDWVFKLWPMPSMLATGPIRFTLSPRSSKLGSLNNLMCGDRKSYARQHEKK